MQKPTLLRLATVVVAAALFAVGCGGADESDASPGQTPATDDSSRLDSALFEGEAQTVDGGSVDLAEFADQDLVLWFWAPW